MPPPADLTTTRQALSRVRADQDAAREAAFATRQRRSQLDSEIVRLKRQAGAGQRGSLAEAMQQREAADRRVREQREHLSGLDAEEQRLAHEFARLSDPRGGIEAMSDQIPFLLFPVRLETRFKTIIDAAGGAQNQLWVRVYPDDCIIDGFESSLSVTELANGRQFWIDWWRAGKDEAGRRAAWRDLAASHGVGRAQWIMQQLQPANPADEPEAPAGRVVLVVPTETALSDRETLAAAEYWRAMWLADGDTRDERDAAAKLESDTSPDRAKAIQSGYRPINMADRPEPPVRKADVKVEVAFLVLPHITDTKQQSWGQAPRVRVMPDRFVFLGYQDGQVIQQLGAPVVYPLICGPDPSAAPEEQLRRADDDLVVPEDMKWMVDFDRAVTSGLGFKVDLDAGQARRGFDQVLVLGIRLAEDEEQSRRILEELIQHQQRSGRGLSLLVQGTPTNNTAGLSSGLSRGDEPDDAFEDLLAQDDLFADESDPSLKRDGQWLAECLGIDPAVLKRTHNAGGTDQLEARALNLALWPATLGYFMESMMHPMFDDQTIEHTRQFFTQFVSGRGAVPALRIHSQPYGILPATAFSRMNWFPLGRGAGSKPDEGRGAFFLRQLYEVLRRAGVHWSGLAAGVSRVGTPSAQLDPHQVLLDIVGLHPGSVEFHQRYAESLDHLFNLLNVGGYGNEWMAALLRLGFQQPGTALLRQLGYTGESVPDILNLFFLSDANLLKGPVVDDRPLSEVEPIRAYTANGRNYLLWLSDAARDSLETLRTQTGFVGDAPPTALLYLFLRHALMLAFWKTGERLYNGASVTTPEQTRAQRREPRFVHVQQQEAESESRWAPLYKAEPRVTGSPNQMVAEYIVSLLGSGAATNPIDELIEALGHLKDVPTARLERSFSEHIDCCSYRYDAWLLGLVHYQLTGMRSGTLGNQSAARAGIHLGAYGWLEEVRRAYKTVTPVALPPSLDPIFNRPGDSALVRDSTNGGYVLAPSLNHAVTAAVLRSGYLANATPENPASLAVNLTSTRVRLALSFLEGVRGGQSLGALLGYQLERGLHDRSGVTEVDGYVFGLRREFPLRANRIATTKEDDKDIPIEALEARNVVDGLSLLEHIKLTGSRHYPFGKPLPEASAADAAAIDAEVVALLDIHDAIADLGLAESVHQAVQGNFDRAAGVMDTFSRGNFPQEPDVIRTPRSGHLITHRVGLQFEAGVSAAVSPVAGIPMTPRAKAAPALNKWLASVLPAPADVGATVGYFDVGAGQTVDVVVTQQDLALQGLAIQPIDLLYLSRPEQEQAMSELDDRIATFVSRKYSPRPDGQIAIRYTEQIPSKVTFFELSALLRPLRSLVLQSRALRSTDVSLSNEARREQDEGVSLDRTAVAALHNDLETLKTAFTALQTTLKPLVIGLPGTRGQLLGQIDSLLSKTISLLERASRFGLLQTGWGFSAAWAQSQFRALIKLVAERVDLWESRLSRFDELVGDYRVLVTDGASEREKLAVLRRAEIEVSTSVAKVTPLTPSSLATALGLKRGRFEQRLAELRAVLRLDTTSLQALRDAIENALPLDAFDFEALDLAASDAGILNFAQGVNSRVTGLLTDIDARLDRLKNNLTAHDATTSSRARVELLEASLKAVLGEEFKAVPEFGVSAAQGAEWDLALKASRDDALLRHARTLHDFPVDDWLYGVARVRDRLHDWEQLVMLSGALSADEPVLTPIQLPHQADDYWLGLEVPQQPQKYRIDGDRLLYTAHYAVPFDKSGRQCGLLLDEWTELIPTEEETIGATFHFDRPNSEPPHALLLVTPPAFRGSWQWQDLADAVSETFELARKRAVEPTQLDASPYAPFLPATVMAATLHDITIATPLTVNNGLYTQGITHG